MNGLFQYSIIRFRPFVETGEFANIGVVVIDAKSGKMAFALVPRKFARIRNFFETLDVDSFAAAIDLLRVELDRLTDYWGVPTRIAAQLRLEEVVRQRESSIIFSEIRALKAEGALEVTATRLFSRYIRRDFSHPIAPEKQLTKDIRVELRRRGLKQFRAVKIDDDIVPVSFPLAINGRELRAIKPLAFSQQSPLAVIDYGAHWRNRLNQLLDRGKILRNNVLLAIEGPNKGAEPSMVEAFKLALKELEELPFEIVEAEQDGEVNPDIVEFAKESMQTKFHSLKSSGFEFS